MGLQSIPTTRRITAVQNALKEQLPKAYWEPGKILKQGPARLRLGSIPFSAFMNNSDY